MGAELTRCCGVDDDYYEQINTTKKGEDDEERDSERKKIKRKLKTVLVHKDAEFAKYIKTEKYERVSNISPTKEEALLTYFAKSELTKEITWDILLAIASKKYGELELARLRSKKRASKTEKTSTPDHNTNHDNDDQADIEKEIEMESKYDDEDQTTNGHQAADTDQQQTNGLHAVSEDDHKQASPPQQETPSNAANLEEYKNLRDENEMLPLSTLSFRLPWNSLYKFVRPSSVQELQQEMQSAVSKGHKIRAMGSRYAWTNVTFTDGLLVDMYNSLNKPKLDIDGNCFNKYGKELHSQSNLLLTECGANVTEIHELLWPHGRRKYLTNKQSKPYKMIPDLPGYSDICIGGLVQSGGYGIGTPYHYGSFVNHVRSFCMLIVDDKKKVRRIQVEPSPENGAIHDAYKWARKYKDIPLIQNDSTFHSLLVSVGSCGIMYSAFIELMDAHYLYERRYLMSWKQFKHKKWKQIDKKCKNGDIVRLQLYISPYLTYDKKYRESPPVIINTYEYTEEMPSHHITEREGGYHRSRDQERSTILASLLATRFANKWPRLVPFILQMSMESTCHAGIAISAVDAIQFGNYNIVPTHKSGFGMNAASFTAIGDDYIRLCNILRAKCSKQIITQPVAIRFSNPGFGLLNFTYNQSSVILEQSLYDFRQSIYFENEYKSVDVNVNDGNNEDAEQKDRDSNDSTQDDKQQNGKKHRRNNSSTEQLQICSTTTPKLWHTLFKIQDLCMGEKYKGKPHLGLYFHVDENIWKNHDDSFKEFVETYKKFNPHQTFCNPFTKESGLDKSAGFL